MLLGIDGQTTEVRTVSPMKQLEKGIPGRGNISTKTEVRASVDTKRTESRQVWPKGECMFNFNMMQASILYLEVNVAENNAFYCIQCNCRTVQIEMSALDLYLPSNKGILKWDLEADETYTNYTCLQCHTFIHCQNIPWNNLRIKD